MFHNYVNDQLRKYNEKHVQLQQNPPANVLANFAKIKNLEDRVRFTLKLLQNCGLPSKSEVTFGKNAENAESARLMGNMMYQRKDYVTALKLYNQSLCLSEKGSKTMGLAYANRSAVYFNTGFYRLCLENIELALQNGYPEELKFKLVKRKNDSLYELEQGREREIKSVDVPKLSYPAHPTIPFMVEGIEMKVSKKYGRHLVAKQDFNPGDILMLEKANAKCLYAEDVNSYCYYCLKSNLMSLLPCDEAVSAMFCSEKCYKESLDKFFKYEAQIIDAVYGTQRHKMLRMRILFEVICLVEDLDGLIEFYNSLDSKNKNPFVIDYKNATRLDLLRSFFTLESHEKSRPTVYNFNLALETGLIYHLIAECTDLKNLIKTKAHEDTLMKFLLRTTMILSINMNVIDKFELKSGKSPLNPKAEASHLITHLMNHSCDPNVSITGEDSEILYVLRPIKAGEQLFFTLGEFSLDKPKSERQKTLKSRYFFECNCMACNKNYPLSKDLQPKGLDYSHIKTMVNIKKVLIAKENGKIRELLKMCNEFLKRYYNFVPCLELAEVGTYRDVCIQLLTLEEPLHAVLAVAKN